MFKLKTKQEDTGSLPEPVALTPDQLKEMAAMTAGGLSLVSDALITAPGPTRRRRCAVNGRWAHERLAV